MSKQFDIIDKKDHQLLSECPYFTEEGELKKTKTVTMLALKNGDAEDFLPIIDENKPSKALSYLAEKGYLKPKEGGKLKISDLLFQASMNLYLDYQRSFLDIMPFLEIE